MQLGISSGGPRLAPNGDELPDGTNPADLAAEHGHEEGLRVLAEANADMAAKALWPIRQLAWP